MITNTFVFIDIPQNEFQNYKKKLHVNEDLRISTRGFGTKPKQK